MAVEGLPLSADELALVSRVAKRDGISEDEAATNLVKQALAYRAGKRGQRTARILPIRQRKT